jgi:hypothetical protein
MEDQQTDVVSRDRIVAALTELIDALDRRVPHVERIGEISIAREAALLKKEALARIEELKRAGCDQRRAEIALADAVMSDDGGRPPRDETRID